MFFIVCGGYNKNVIESHIFTWTVCQSKCLEYNRKIHLYSILNIGYMTGIKHNKVRNNDRCGSSQIILNFLKLRIFHHFH